MVELDVGGARAAEDAEHVGREIAEEERALLLVERGCGRR